MLKRRAEKEILDWIQDDNNSALLVTGARQVGKTYLIRSILSSSYDYEEINFIKTPALVPVFEHILENGVTRFVNELSFIVGHKIKESSILFLDEVQMCPSISTAIKFLVEEGTFRYILSGSLLGVEVHNIKSAPVGYLSIIEMYPLDFEEFLNAFNVSDRIFSSLHDCFEKMIPVDSAIHEKLMELFYIYLVVGGMPAAVSEYINSGSLLKVSNIQKNIIELYKMDFTRYEHEDKKLRLRKIYDLIPSELDAMNKRYKFTDIDPHFKFDRYENSFNWLIDAGVVIDVHNVKEPMIPLKANLESNLMKVFISDVGLLSQMYGRNTQLKLLAHDSDINNGAIFENYVAQELLCHGCYGYYYSQKKYGELDFIVELDSHVLPLEVKSGHEYKKHKALDNVMNVKNFRIRDAIVFSTNNVEKIGNIRYLPIYMTMYLKSNAADLPKKKIDISILQ